MSDGLFSHKDRDKFIYIDFHALFFTGVCFGGVDHDE